MRRFKMEPISIFILAMLCQVYSCASTVSDSVNEVNYASATSEEYLKSEEIETGLEGKIYFDFDKSSLDAGDKDNLEQFLPYIRNAKVVRLEGHCDERGTREYNLALGERRALEVRDFLIIKGVPGKKIKVVSFGEEKPLARESNESAWAQNRRVEISLY